MTKASCFFLHLLPPVEVVTCYSYCHTRSLSTLSTVERALFLIIGSTMNLFILALIMVGLSILSVFGMEMTRMTRIVEEYLRVGIFGLQLL